MRQRLLALCAVAAVPLIGACGSSSESASSTTQVEVARSNVVATSTTTSLPATPTSGGVTAGPSEYTIQAGDVPVNVARKFGVTLDALNAANANTAGYSAFFVGLKIVIPGGGTQPAATTPTATTPTATTAATPSATTATTATTLAPDSCKQGTYTIVDGDYPLKVAEKLGTTVEALDAANADTAGYSAFFAGLKIKLPKKAGC
jgi:LysM repeat protein